ncbi:hypothetical protein PF003_g25517 [Phytophthora fragariae]|nr:hypothetical protein PF003_g25517 [Phytophthora fragariae]
MLPVLSPPADGVVAGYRELSEDASYRPQGTAFDPRRLRASSTSTALPRTPKYREFGWEIFEAL